MHAHPRRTLRWLFAQHGPALLDDSACVDALLADLCGEFHRERFLLVHALRGRVATELRLYPQGDIAHELRLAQRLQQRYCFSAEAAHWAVESWSLASKAGATTKPIDLEAAQTQFDTAVERYKTAKARLNEAQGGVDKVIAQGKIARTKLNAAKFKFDAAVEQYRTAEERSAEVQGEVDRAIAHWKIAKTELEAAQSKFNAVVGQYRKVEARSNEAQGEVDKAITQGEIARTELEVESRPLVPDSDPLNPNTLRDSKGLQDGLVPVLSEGPQLTLRQLLADYGPALLDEPARVEALLADRCGPDHRERFLLVHALRERIPVKLQTQPQNGAVYGRQFSQQLQKRYGFSSKAARWTIECWLFALKRIAPLAQDPTQTDQPSNREEEATAASSRERLNQELFENLRALRDRIASERNVPHHAIFTDVTLHLMVYYRPQSRDELTRIRGVDVAKLEKWVDEFLAVIRNHARLHNLGGIPVGQRDSIHSDERDGSNQDRTEPPLSSPRQKGWLRRLLDQLRVR